MALLAAYSFDETSGDVLDRSGNGRDWVLNNGAVLTENGHTGNGLTKAGGAGSMTVVASPAFGETSERTVMFWQQNPGNSVWWIRWTSGTDTARWGIYNLSGSLRARMVTTSGTANAGPVPFPTDGLWHHYAATYDGSFVRLFIDAVQVASAAQTGTPLAADRIDMMEHTLANFADDDLRIFDNALDAASIQSWMNTPVIDEPVEEGAVTRVYVGGSWQPAPVKVYVNGGWVEAPVRTQ